MIRIERLRWFARDDMISGSFMSAMGSLTARRRCVLRASSAAVRAEAELEN